MWVDSYPLRLHVLVQASYTARDAERIMNTVDALLASETVEWDASPTASLLDALEVLSRAPGAWRFYVSFLWNIQFLQIIYTVYIYIYIYIEYNIGGFLKRWYPQNHWFQYKNGVILDDLGYAYFRSPRIHVYIYIYIHIHMSINEWNNWINKQTNKQTNK